MSLPVTFSHNNTRVYTISGGTKEAPTSTAQSLPEWLARKHKRSLRQDVQWRQRIELIQDFQFPEAALRIRFTPNQEHIIATGVYKPQMRVYELAEMSMKFDRHCDCDNVQMQILGEDWTKVALLQSDRTIELHAQGGIHFKTRVPKFGRDMQYDATNCELITVGASHEVWRLNLDHGRFMAPFETCLSTINVAHINPAHRLYGFGGDDGALQFWDPRQRQALGQMIVPFAGSADETVSVTALHFLPDGLNFAVGTSDGRALLYDLRFAANATHIHQHYDQSPVHHLSYHCMTRSMVSADKRVIQFWQTEQASNTLVTIEPQYAINDVCIQHDTGFVMAACETSEIQSFYIPSLGPAPKWCPFLDNLTEELEEKTLEIYDDYKFVTRQELSQLALDHLIGTNVLRAYMHGFFIDLRLYEKAKAIANPFAYDEYRRQKVTEKLEKERQSRIAVAVHDKLPKVNRALAQRLQAVDHKGKSNPAVSLVQDKRFAALFENKDFEVDETSRDFQLLHASGVKQAVTEVKQEDHDEAMHYKGKATTTNVSAAMEASYSSEDDSGEEWGQRPATSVQKTKSRSFADRLKTLRPDSGPKKVSLQTGNIEATFSTKKKTKSFSRESHSDQRQRRGVAELGLKRLPRR